jgi:hypothetical protein
MDPCRCNQDPNVHFNTAPDSEKKTKKKGNLHFNTTLDSEIKNIYFLCSSSEARKITIFIL